jgi:hypothetical protein
LACLGKKPAKKVTGIFLGIIISDSSGLPILEGVEIPSVTIAGTSFDPLQNIQAKMITKVTLLFLVKSESEKLGIWDQLKSPWAEKYTHETKMYVHILEAIKNQFENTSQNEKIAGLIESIERIKAANLEYNIQW